MGVAQAGIIVNSKYKKEELHALVELLSNRKLKEIDHPNFSEFDVRNENDFMIEVFGDVYVISNHHLVWNLMSQEVIDSSHIYTSLGCPELFFVFCRYDSGGSYGYAIFENGVRARYRLQTVGSAILEALVEGGEPNEVEQNWLSGEVYLEEDDCPEEDRQKIVINNATRKEVPEYYLTNAILESLLISYFNLIPWDSKEKPIYHFYKELKKISWWKKLIS